MANKSKLPNILFIQVDQLPPSALSFHGNRVTKTPHLDQLAKESAIFDAAYCNYPLCGPSRSSMMTGQLASRIGAYDNGTDFPTSIPTMAHYLRALGYRSALSGKMHFVGPDQLHGFEERLTAEIYPTDFKWTPNWQKNATEFHAPDTRFTSNIGVAKWTGQMDHDEEVVFRSVNKIYDWARDPDERPFFLLTSLTHPHDPYICTQEYWDRYDESEIDLPKISLTNEQQDPHSQRVRSIYGLDRVEMDESRLRTLRHGYFGNVSYIDDKVGQLLDALELTGLAENTIVLFTSDHGEMLGERNLIQKKTFFEDATRVPLLIKMPNGQSAGQRHDEHVSLVDLLPTLVDFADQDGEVDRLSPLDGESLVPLLSNGSLARENVVYSENLSESVTAPLLMVRRDQWKLIWCPTDPTILYNLAQDPDELENLAGNSDYTDVEAALIDELHQQWDVDALHQQVLQSQRQRQLIAAALDQGQYQDWQGDLPRSGQLGYMKRKQFYHDWNDAGKL
ncbi:MAG: choline-sulfatase [Chloroflexota bacterium]